MEAGRTLVWLVTPVHTKLRFRSYRVRIRATSCTYASERLAPARIITRATGLTVLMPAEEFGDVSAIRVDRESELEIELGLR